MSAAKYEVGQDVCVHFKWDTFTIPDNEGMIQGVIQSAAKTEDGWHYEVLIPCVGHIVSRHENEIVLPGAAS